MADVKTVVRAATRSSPKAYKKILFHSMEIICSSKIYVFRVRVCSKVSGWLARPALETDAVCSSLCHARYSYQSISATYQKAEFCR